MGKSLEMVSSCLEEKEQVDSNLGNDKKKKKKVDRGRPKNMTLVEVVKDMLIKEVIEIMIMNRI